MSGWKGKEREGGYGVYGLKDLSELEMLTPNTTPCKIRTGAKDVKVGKASEKDSDIVEGLAF